MIVDRPLTDLELDCVVLSQERLRKDPAYLELLNKRHKLLESIKLDNEDRVHDLTLPQLDELAGIEYQIGYWDGIAFAELMAEKKVKDWGPLVQV